MEQEKNQLDEQGTKPYDQKEGLQDSNQSGEDIRSGARDEDQLSKIKENSPEGGRDAYPERQQGAPPDTYLEDENQKWTKDVSGNEGSGT
ncbi:hypothetical protein [Mucilaginibacter lacusdianchii]|uniref:hypothetical protein n=1 Tax=Mucilaginibacter lacusdianchii TaxID=2684211 RepID=UPI00131E3E4D|nr:hypothetical protein [Mucilaginibacter sp. JXJ CY 39]